MKNRITLGIISTCAGTAIILLAGCASIKTGPSTGPDPRPERNPKIAIELYPLTCGQEVDEHLRELIGGRLLELVMQTDRFRVFKVEPGQNVTSNAVYRLEGKITGTKTTNVVSASATNTGGFGSILKVLRRGGSGEGGYTTVKINCTIMLQFKRISNGEVLETASGEFSLTDTSGTAGIEIDGVGNIQGQGTRVNPAIKKKIIDRTLKDALSKMLPTIDADIGTQYAQN